MCDNGGVWGWCGRRITNIRTQAEIKIISCICLTINYAKLIPNPCTFARLLRNNESRNLLYLCSPEYRPKPEQLVADWGRNSSVGSAWARCPQRRGFEPPLGIFPVEGIFPLELTWVQTPFPQKLLRMRV